MANRIPLSNPNIEIKFDLKKLLQIESKAKKTVQNSRRNLHKGMEKAIRRVVATARKDYLRGPRPDKLGVQTGALIRSITGKITRSTKHIVKGTTGSDLEYAAIHEHGGIIQPKVSQYLAIPLGKTQGKPRDYPDAFFITSKKNNLLIVKNNGGELLPLFLLKKQVEIPARPFLKPAYLDNKKKVQEDLRDAYLTAWLKGRP